MKARIKTYDPNPLRVPDIPPRTRSKNGVCTVAALLALALPAFAADKEKLTLERSADEVSLDDLMRIKVPSVRGASRFEQKETEAPANVTVITAADFKQHGWRTIGEALNSVRGLYTTNSHSYTFAGIRGFSRPGDFNGHMLLLVDGVRMNDNIYSAALLGHEAIVDVSLVDHIEVIRGSTSSLYGSNAFFGVVNVVTKDPGAYKNGEASAGIGSYDAGKTNIALAHSFDSGLKFLLHGTWFESQGQDLYFRRFGRGISDLDSEDTQKLFAKLIYGDFTLTSAYSRRDKQVPLPYNGSPFDDRAAHEVDRLAFVDLRYKKALDSGWEIQAHASYNWYWFDGYFSYLDVIPTDPDRPVVNYDQGRGEWLETEFQINKRFLEKYTLTLGGDLRYNFKQAQRNLDISPFALLQDDMRHSKNYGAFAQLDAQIIQEVRINVGVRLDHYSTFGNTTNPRLGIIWNPSERTSLKLLYGTAFRAPNPYEFAYSGTTALHNSELAPERVRTTELVLEQEITRNLRATLSLYENHTKGLIEQVVVDPVDGTSQFQNRDGARSRGVELELESQFKNGIRARASYAFQTTEDDLTGGKLSNSPQHLAKALIAIPIVGERVTAGLEGHYRSSVRTLAGATSDNFWFANVNLLARDVGITGLDLSAGVFNITDERFELPGSDDNNDLIEQERRTFFIQATYRF